MYPGHFHPCLHQSCEWHPQVPKVDSVMLNIFHDCPYQSVTCT